MSDVVKAWPDESPWREDERADPNWGRTCLRCGASIRAGCRHLHVCPAVSARTQAFSDAAALLSEMADRAVGNAMVEAELRRAADRVRRLT